MSNTNTEVLTTAYEKLQGALTQSNTVLPKLEEAVEKGNLDNYATVSQLEEKANKGEIIWSDLKTSSDEYKLKLINLSEEVINTIKDPMMPLYSYPDGGLQIGRCITGEVDVSTSMPNRFIVNTTKINVESSKKVIIKCDFDIKILVYGYNGDTGLGYIDFVNYTQGSYVVHQDNATDIRITIAKQDDSDFDGTEIITIYSGGGSFYSEIKDNSITSSKYANGSISNSKINETISKVIAWRPPVLVTKTTDIGAKQVQLEGVISSTDNFTNYWNMPLTTYSIPDGYYLIYNFSSKTITTEQAKTFVKSSDKYILIYNFEGKLQSPIPMYQYVFEKTYEKLGCINNVIEVGKDKGYTTINSALTYALTIASSTNPITIKVYPGVYEEVVNVYGGKYISIVGVNKLTCILRDDSGIYANAPLRISGEGYVANMTIIATHDDDTTSNISNLKSYAIHADDEGIGTLEVNNCILISKQNAAIGSGLHKSQGLRLVNCELYSETPTESAMSKNGALFVHSQFKENVTGQKLEVINCKITSKYGNTVYINDSNKQLTGTSKNSVMDCTFINNNIYSETLGKTNIIKVDAPNNSNCLSGEITLNARSYGNNINEFNVV